MYALACSFSSSFLTLYGPGPPREEFWDSRRGVLGMWERRRRAVDGEAIARFLIRSTRRAALTLVGFVLVVIGLAGLVLPVLPGWVLIIAGFAVLSREYSWAYSCLAFCRKHAARSGNKVRAFAARQLRRGDAAVGREIVLDSGEVVIDLTSRQQDEASEPAARERSSRAL